MVRALLKLNKKMNHWNNFCNPSTGREFFPHFWVEILSKDFTVRKSFSRFFPFSSTERDFFPHFWLEILAKDFTVRKSFSGFFFRTFSSTGRVFTLILGCNFYLKDFNK